MTPDQRDAQARNRFFLIALSRLAGVALTVAGIVATAGRIAPIPPVAGYAMVLIGLGIMIFLPRSLARRWRSPK